MATENEEISGPEGEQWHVRAGNNQTYGPISLSTLCEWAAQGRIAADNEISHDRKTWSSARSLPDLGMEWIVELGGGKRFGPINLKAAPHLVRRGVVDLGAVLRHTRTGERRAVRAVLQEASAPAPAVAPVPGAPRAPAVPTPADDARLRKLEADLKAAARREASLNRRLEREREARRQDKAAAREQRRTLKQEQAAAARRAASRERRIERLRQRLSARDEAARELRQKHTAEKRDVRREAAKQARLARELRQRLEKIEAELKRERTRRQALQEESAQTQAGLQSRLAHLSESASSGTDLLDAAQAELVKLKSQAKDRAADQERARKRIEGKLKKADESAAAMRRELNGVTRDMEQLKLEAERARQRADMLDTARQREEQAAARMRAKLSELSKDLYLAQLRCGDTQDRARSVEARLREEISRLQQGIARQWYMKTEDGEVYGPIGWSELYEWAAQCRIDPECLVSTDRAAWRPARELPELRMEWMVTLSDGDEFGPIQARAVEHLIEDDMVVPSAPAVNVVSGEKKTAGALIGPPGGAQGAQGPPADEREARRGSAVPPVGIVGQARRQTLFSG